MIAQGSLRFILPPILISLIFIILEQYLFSIPFLIIALYMTWFFRDPKREIVKNEDHLLSAADGIIKEIRQEANGDLKIAVRMSPFNVHLNRAPYEGKIVNIKHKPGLHKTVYFAGAEEKNEQNLIEIESNSMNIDILQITGAFARRIECWVKVRDNVNQGDKIGIIRFGSQTNMVCKVTESKKMLKPVVKEGDKVYAGLTVVAQFGGP